MRSLNHANIIKFLDAKLMRFKKKEEYIIVVMEYAKGGTLQHFIHKRWKRKNPITEDEAATITIGILEGLSYLHSEKKVHRDIKPGDFFNL